MDRDISTTSTPTTTTKCRIPTPSFEQQVSAKSERDLEEEISQDDFKTSDEYGKCSLMSI
jgi:hypothetical protein